MKKLMIWAAVHGAHWALLYGAFALNLEGALYVLKFFAWAMLPLALLTLTTWAQESMAKEPRAPIRGYLSRVQAWTTLLLLVWFGHIATGLAWGLVMLCMGICRVGVTKLREKQQAQPA